MPDFASIIIAWYRKNARDLPWRRTKNPYPIWLSEVILQQTRVDQGMKYYYHFLENYPSVLHLANASEEQVLKSWQGLGYYSRARNLHQTAKLIVNEFRGEFPNSYNELLQLKGIGPYTAAAISSFAFGEKKAVVDGNVNRVVARYFGMEEGIDSSAGKNAIQEIVNDQIPDKDPATFNQAIMEFGALQCVPKNPNCTACPLHDSCYAFRKGKVTELPVKNKKTLVRNLFIHYLVLEKNNQWFFTQRDDSSIWKNMWEFPSVFSEDKDIKGSIKNTDFAFNGEADELGKVTKKHVLSHRNIVAVFHHRRWKKGKIPVSWLPVSLGDAPNLAISRLVERYIEEDFGSFR